jgi:hypothetical protein
MPMHSKDIQRDLINEIWEQMEKNEQGHNRLKALVGQLLPDKDTTQGGFIKDGDAGTDNAKTG